MEINSFVNFETLLAEAQTRKDTLTHEISALKKLMTTQIDSFDRQVASGQDPEKLLEQMDALQKKIDTRSQEWDTWDSAISGKDRTSPIYQAAQDVWKEGVELITKELKRQWNNRIAELEKAKAAYLAVCAELGSVQRKAEEVSNKLSSALEGFLPPSGVPRLVTGIDLEELTGVIFPDYNEIKKAFLRGG
ncbi:MAG: hypothetical protein AB1491_03830 [Thermodesulfobacteriota bacterium]